METRPVVTCFLRCDGELLLLRRSQSVGSYPDRWGAVAGHVATDAEDPTAPATTPAAAAHREIAEETGIAQSTLVRAGDVHDVVDEDLGVTWRVHPFLFAVGTRAVTTNEETAAVAWLPAPAMLRRDTVPNLWESYDRVRPRVGTVRADRAHGSAWVSLRALECLRDEAALADRHRDPSGAEREGNAWTDLAALARELRSLRPSMAVLENRVNRAMHEAAADGTPAAVEGRATAAIDRAVAADGAAAERAGPELPPAVATLSRSGTVMAAIRAAAPDSLLVAASRPGGEGRPVAETLADTTDVTLTTDAAFPALLARRAVGALVVGADRILPNGDVSNKVGTRAAALSAPAGCDCVVVAASDKIAHEATVDREERAPEELYDGDAALSVANPTFDVTPARAVDAVVTERGVLDAGAVADIAAEHARLADW